MRKILSILFEDNKLDPVIKVILNVSLPVKCKLWEEIQSKYYLALVGKVS